MASIVLSIVNLATRSVFNNICDRIANTLTHGDCTDEKCRQMIVRELDEIKTRLDNDGLARKDLLSSVCFLKDGLCSLNHSFESTENESETNGNENKLDYVKECLQIDGARGTDHELPRKESNEELRCQIAILNKALNGSLETRTSRSKERLVSAKSSFEVAYSKATEAFNNESLSTTERILATKLRVASKILQCLEDPSMAMVFCKLYLQQLHELPAVRKRFAVFFQGKVKSHLSKKKRANNIRCVMELNYALYEYVKSFAKTDSLKVLAGWPRIKVRQKAFNPLLVSNKILKKMLKCGLGSPNQLLSKEFNNCECAVINSKGEVIVTCKNEKGLRLFSKCGEIVESFCLDLEATETRSFEILALAVNSDDEVYAVARYKKDGMFHYELYVLDAELRRVRQQVLLRCLTGAGEVHHKVCLAVDSNKNVLITKQDDAKILIFDRNGKPTNNFTLPNWNLIKDLKISATGDVVAAELVGKMVGIYTESGTLKQDIAVPGLHKVCGLAIDHIDNAVIVLTEVLTAGCSHEYRLLRYSESGKLSKTLVLPRQRETTGYHITSHPSGSLVVVHETGVLFLHH